MTQSSGRPVSPNGAKMFKVAFDLDLERADWPPVSVERLWGEKTEVKYEIRVVNTPFFARGIAFGDLIRVRPDNERRELVFESFTSESGHSTIRVIFLEEGERESVEEKFRAIGCNLSSSHGFASLIAVDIPPSVNYEELRQWLLRKVESEVIEIQESAISAIHRRQLTNFP
ncbi:MULTISPECIES: DUF4265 domain-containing protein [Streptomyces]|uniref:DUF4265 domain-containing protein n=1 Tax=Streptomyces TaxID=1883 RepID=UPI00117ECAB1|nr:DUF4265 domain-containing protein [Streptomyces murinus]MYR01327.1 DUF4265 domain-containing protein [Streptomyces sp. SID6139]MYR17300.1 DUF4265 domain-containing protein [Streptomyces sp. SID6137]